MFNFTPIDDEVGINIPFFEEARAKTAPYYTAGQRGRKTVDDAKNEVLAELAKLGAGVRRIVAGRFDEMNPPRYGFKIEYFFGGMPGRLDVACLPMKSVTDQKLREAQVQSLLIVRDWIKAAVTAQVFAPGSNFLIAHLLVDGEHTVMEYIASTGKLPQLNPPASKIVVEDSL